MNLKGFKFHYITLFVCDQPKIINVVVTFIEIIEKEVLNWIRVLIAISIS